MASIVFVPRLMMNDFFRKAGSGDHGEKLMDAYRYVKFNGA